MDKFLKRPADILLVEDNPGDVRLVQEAFRACDVDHTLNVVEDGDRALGYLRRQGAYTESTRPDLIILDWNLPNKPGREVLEAVKQDPDLQPIPIVVFTTSRAPQDLQEAYDLRASCFITKPAHFREFVEAIEGIRDFWLGIATLPSAPT
ncbi:MAG TPA: response regulator [Armatimonadota bacterium]|jgi:CheY-like chemotaxis protein